jgi:hypothetical protein
MSQHDAPSLRRGEAYHDCVRELQNPHPNYARAQVLATLSLHEAASDAADEAGALSAVIRETLLTLNDTIEAASMRR